MVYRPNEAKVKNLKAKDYLGKARLIAASDRNNTPGALGLADAKRTTPPAIEQRTLEDRSAENVSYGATNLIQKSLVGRSRQHSEPPLNRNMFPPTPPPDADKASTNSSSTTSLGGTGRSASVRAARPPRLDLDRPGANVVGRQGANGSDKPRIGPTRTASETRGQTSQPRGLYIQNAAQPQQQQGHWGHDHRRNMSDTGFAPNGYQEEAYGIYPPTRRSLVMSNGGSRRMMMPRHQQPQQYIDEEEEYASDACDEEPGTFDDGEFEIVDTSSRRRTSSHRTSHHARRRPEINKFRIKVHAAEDTRYIMVGPNIGFAEFESRVRDKFGFLSSLKMRMQDDGDMVTMVDQEDLDLLLISAKEFARREGSEMGKMEVSYTTWIQELLCD